MALSLSTNAIWHQCRLRGFSEIYGADILLCAIIVDDIIVGGRDLKEHDENVRKVLDRAHKVRLRLNSEKCKFLLKEVSYVGHVFTEQGLKPDPPKVQAIADIPPPEDKAALQRFLGIMNYLGKFIPNHSTSAPAQGPSMVLVRATSKGI